MHGGMSLGSWWHGAGLMAWRSAGGMALGQQISVEHWEPGIKSSATQSLQATSRHVTSLRVPSRHIASRQQVNSTQVHLWGGKGRKSLWGAMVLVP